MSRKLCWPWAVGLLSLLLFALLLAVFVLIAVRYQSAGGGDEALLSADTVDCILACDASFHRPLGPSDGVEFVQPDDQAAGRPVCRYGPANGSSVNTDLLFRLLQKTLVLRQSLFCQDVNHVRLAGPSCMLALQLNVSHTLFDDRFFQCSPSRPRSVCGKWALRQCPVDQRFDRDQSRCGPPPPPTGARHTLRFMPMPFSSSLPFYSPSPSFPPMAPVPFQFSGLQPPGYPGMMPYSFPQPYNLPMPPMMPPMMPPPMMGPPMPMMSPSMPMMGQPPLMMGGPSPMMGGAGPMMGGPSPMMGGPSPMMGGPSPMMGGPGPMMGGPPAIVVYPQVTFPSVVMMRGLQPSRTDREIAEHSLLQTVRIWWDDALKWGAGGQQLESAPLLDTEDVHFLAYGLVNLWTMPAAKAAVLCR